MHVYQIQEDVLDAAMFYNIYRETYEELSQEIDDDDTFDSANGYLISGDQMIAIMAHQKFIMDLWQQGTRITPPLPIFGIDEVLPDPMGVPYTKPILVLINELDFSCADVFPAILRDNGRATLFGKKTAGAGGYVRPYPALSRFGVAGYTLTGSLLYRLDGTSIENLGVSPDIPYEITERDLSENYSDYVQAVNTAVDAMVSN